MVRPPTFPCSIGAPQRGQVRVPLPVLDHLAGVHAALPDRRAQARSAGPCAGGRARPGSARSRAPPATGGPATASRRPAGCPRPRAPTGPAAAPSPRTGRGRSARGTPSGVIVSASGPITSRSGSRRTRPRRRVSRSRNWPPSAKVIVNRFHAGLRGGCCSASGTTTIRPLMPRCTPRCGPGSPCVVDGLAPHRLALAVRRDELPADAARPRCRRGGAGGTPTRRSRPRRRSCGRAPPPACGGRVRPRGARAPRQSRPPGTRMRVETDNRARQQAEVGGRRLDAVWSPRAYAPPSCAAAAG